AGDPGAAVKYMILHGRETLNARLIDNAFQVLQKHGSKVADLNLLSATVNELRQRYATHNAKASLGEQKRQAGGLALRTGAKANDKPVAKAL
ncbi:MAG: response regulator, partial [Rhodoferax sp.]